MKYFVYCRRSSEAEDRQVMSIESQRRELEKAFGGRSEIERINIFEESKSAKVPGRLIFDDMLARIEKGEASGIIAWAPDRLARNSIDGGRVVYLLDRGVLRDLKFATYTFENNSQGKFMLQIMFGQSKYYSDALSENVKRGNQTKIERGWRPNMAPLGYMNDSATKTIVKDPNHFALIRKIFDLMLTGAYSPRQIALIARDEWGFRTPKRRKIGGSPMAMSTIYKILSNPFYAGLIVWTGQIYPGKHEPVVSITEFERVRELLQRPHRPRPQKHVFAFTGMIRCGSCGLQVTAEHKINRYGYRYTYYHCTKRRLGPRCQEPSVEAHSLEAQIAAFLHSLAIPAEIEASIMGWLAGETERFKHEDEARKRLLQHARAETAAQLTELTGLRLRNLLTDEEYVARRRELQLEGMRLDQKISDADIERDRFEPFREVISFRNQAADWFWRGDEQSKRLIMEIVGSNLTLTNKKLSIQAAKPFLVRPYFSDCLYQLAGVDDIRTLKRKSNRKRADKTIALFVRRTERALKRERDLEHMLENIIKLRKPFAPRNQHRKAA